MINQVLASVMILSSVISVSLACAGECIEDAEVYLKELQAITDVSPGSASDRNAIVSRLFCLYNDARFTMAADYPETFASHSALEEIKTANQKNRELCFKVIPRFLKSASPEVRCAAIRVLAYYGWPQVFEFLMRCEDTRPDMKAALFAIVGDRRAVPWIIQQYKRAGARYRDRPDFILHSRMSYLNALYHLASPTQLPFINSIVQNPKPEQIRQRALEVRAHIEQLYPKEKKSRLE